MSRAGVGEGDGRAQARHLDTEQGALGGVGADQIAGPATHGHGDELAAPAPYDVWSRIPSVDGSIAALGEATYYERPVIKEPVWIWTVPAYFHTGGAGGAAAVLGAVAQLHGGLDGLVGRCRWIATGGTALGTVLLIADLGRPARFLNMLRVLRPTSPMSVGSWLLAATSGAAAVSAVGRGRGGVAGGLARFTGLGAGVLGGPLAGYTGVLLSNTAVPAWQGARRTLPLLFAGSSVAAAASLLQLLDLDDDAQPVVRGFHVVGALWELAAGAAVEREVGRVERAARPYHEGASGALWTAAKAATAASLLLSLPPGGSRARRTLAGLLGTVGSLALRFAVFQAGRASSRDPRATFQQQRAGRGAVEVTATPAVTGPGRRALAG